MIPTSATPSQFRTECASEPWDVVIIGAGPAGAFASCMLGRRFRTLLVERARFPRAKVCGGCLNAKALLLLREQGLGYLTQTDSARVIDHLHIRSAAGRATIPLPAGKSICRSTFDEALVEYGTRCGVTFRDATTATVLPIDLRGLEDSCRHIELREAGGWRQVIRARVVLVADGLGHPCLANDPRFTGKQHSQSLVGLGATCAFDGLTEPHAISMFVGNSGYVGIVENPEGGATIAAAVHPALLRQQPASQVVQNLLDQASGRARQNLDWVRSVRWVGTRPLTWTPNRIADERVFLIGDATGYVEPFTGEGMAFALTAARDVVPLVAAACCQWQPTLVEQWERRVLRYRQKQRVCTTIAMMLRSRAIRTLAIRLLQFHPGLAARVVRAINRPTSIETQHG